MLSKIMSYLWAKIENKLPVWLIFIELLLNFKAKNRVTHNWSCRDKAISQYRAIDEHNRRGMQQP